MLKTLYEKLLVLSATRMAPLWLACVSFAESSFFPIPPDVLLIPMILARPRRAWWFAGICTASSVLGGCLGYWIGLHLFDQLALPIVRFYHAEAGYNAFLAFYARWGFWAILAKGLTPIPFKLVTIASGAAHFDFGQFLLACLDHARRTLLPDRGAAVAHLRRPRARLHRPACRPDLAPGACSGDRRRSGAPLL